MATLKEIRDRRNSVKSINKITSALKLVSTAKAQKKLRDLRTYEGFYYKLYSIMQSVLEETNSFKNETRKNTYWIVFTSDLGLAAGFNTLLLKEFILNFDDKNDHALVIGVKGEQILKNKVDISNISFVHQSSADEEVTESFARKLINKYDNEDLNIKIVGNSYINQITNEIKITSVLPIKEQIDEENKLEVSSQILFEPSAHGIIPELLLFYVQSQLNYSLVNSYAAEESARRNAMDNATTNSNDMIIDLTRKYNRIRQSKITQEISELVSGSNVN